MSIKKGKTKRKMKNPVFEITRSDEWIVEVFRTNVTTSREPIGIQVELQSISIKRTLAIFMV